MNTIQEIIVALEASGICKEGEVVKLAAEALQKHGFTAAQIADYIGQGMKNQKTQGAVGMAALGAVGAGAIAAASKAYGALKFHSNMSELRKDPEIAADEAKAISIANMVRRWAPSIAEDPNILKGTVKSLMKFPDSYLTYDIAGKLSDVQKRYADTHGLMSVIKERVL
jgi:hypothetical protein